MPNHQVLAANIRSLQEENHDLKVELSQVKDELKQKDMLIATLQSQLRSLILACQQNTADADNLSGVISEDDDDALSRISSLGFASAMSPIGRGISSGGGRGVGSALGQRLPPPVTSPAKSSPFNKGNKKTTISTIRETSPANSSSNSKNSPISSSTSLPPSNQGKPAQEQVGCGRDDSEKNFNTDDNRQQKQRQKQQTQNAIRTSKGAIKALPRELSIYNSVDDDVTKYSVDDGLPSYVVDASAPIPFRDAYNVRGLYSGSVNRAYQLPDGFGRMQYNIGGTVYEGEWSLGHWHGNGKVVDKHGNKYVGQFLNDLKHGQGREVYADGRIFEGQFADGEAVDGTMIFPNSSKYIGQLRNGERNGYGVYYFEDGSIYQGFSKGNQFEGKGKVTWPDGGWYEGDWMNGTMEGYGKEIRPDGSLRHDGKWNNGVPIRE